MSVSSSWIQQLVLRCFRNHTHSALTLDASPVVLVGENGSGKTNILEAVSFLMPGRGLRSAALAGCSPAATPDQPWQIEAVIMQGDDSLAVRTRRHSTVQGSEKRLVFVDDAEQTASALENLLPQVWLTPKHDRLFIEGSTERRNYLDRIVYGFHPAHAKHRQRYEHLWREREKLLEQGRNNPRWLEALEEQIAAEGISMAAARVDVTAQLHQACQQRAGVFPTVALSCTGWLEERLQAGGDTTSLQDDFRLQLARHRHYGGFPHKAPHRTDLLAVHGVKQCPARECSTGEQKAVLLSITLAQAALLAAHHRRTPLLLLDEVVAHLDAFKRQELFAEILASGCQAWLTGTDSLLFDGLLLHAQPYQVKEGTVNYAQKKSISTATAA